ncbi:hypothetical protein Celal_3788 [Cellulophaga algicola DSM 14237]|uniref:Uncharacterized protein n=1 Tax=Cellulophaga algicola (strain DSM 14237 / IC166 / ACAM 630) TaxID=688270 RepID=E6XAS5_CELAD|nr:hypothetical protein Celal_3788 [Cellulophaga algicola DSM 14237]
MLSFSNHKKLNKVDYKISYQNCIFVVAEKENDKLRREYRG